jgi:hypothetical protein
VLSSSGDSFTRLIQKCRSHLGSVACLLTYLRIYLCRTDGIRCDGGISILNDNETVRCRCRFVRRNQASPATQKVPAPVMAERNSDVSPLVRDKTYRDFTVLHCMTHKEN